MRLGITYVPSWLTDHIQSDLAEIRQTGANEVLVALQENHLEFMVGALRETATLAEQQGLTPYACLWGFARTFGGGRISNFIVNEPGIWRVNAEGHREAIGCLNQPRLLAGHAAAMTTCYEHGYRGIFIDEPTPQTCFCEACQEKFTRLFGGDLKQAASAKDEDHLAFQRLTIHDYVKGMCTAAKELDKDFETTCCLMPHDWTCAAPIVGLETLDVFSTDPYWLIGNNRTIEWATGVAQKAVELAKHNGKACQIWLNGWKIGAGREEEVYTGGHALAQSGCDSLYTWGFRGCQGTIEAADRPQEVWKAISRLYGELSKIGS